MGLENDTLTQALFDKVDEMYPEEIDNAPFVILHGVQRFQVTIDPKAIENGTLLGFKLDTDMKHVTIIVQTNNAAVERILGREHFNVSVFRQTNPIFLQ